VWAVFPPLVGRRTGSSSGGACPTAPGLAQYDFKSFSLWTEICLERSTRYVWLGSTSIMQYGPTNLGCNLADCPRFLQWL